MRLTSPFSFRRPRAILDFEEDRYSWSDRQRRRARQESVWWRPYYDWMMKQPPMARPVIVLLWVTLFYLAFVFGILIGAGLGPMIW